MSWVNELIDLYEINSDKIGVIEYRRDMPYVLLPPFHTTVTAQITVTITVKKLRDIKQILIKVSDANDFVEILCEIMKMKEENGISKEQIDGMKSKWRQYKMTKKQIVNIYELL